MNANKASLDYLDFRTGLYHRNRYGTINPEAQGLGDVGNAIGSYGTKLYIVVNASNKIEILEASSGKRIKQLDITNCRSLGFHGGKVYVSAYLGKVGDPQAPNGIVAEIDTTSLSITRQVEVGRQPEELAIVGNKLYVANSGNYSPPQYERTVSVIDLTSFQEIKRIDVAINLHRLKADAYGDLYVTSRGDNYDTPSRLYVIDTHNDQIKKQLDIPVSQLTIDDDRAYLYSADWNYLEGTYTFSYHLLDVKNEQLLAESFIRDGTEKQIAMPYGIAVNPETKEVYVADARDYVTPGQLYCYSPDGQRKWSVTTGDIPAHFAFVY